MVDRLYTSRTPPEIATAKGLHLITHDTPNGQRVQILLEELAAAYPGTVEWTTTILNISFQLQKLDWYLRLNPNGKIPILVDNTRNPPFTVLETSAEMLYLLKFDKENKFGFEDEREQSQCLQWLFFWHGGGAPIQREVEHFTGLAVPTIPYAINRFRAETLRVFGVLEIQLAGQYSHQPRDYLAGAGKGKYSIADIGAWPWVSKWRSSRFTDEDMSAYPHLLRWVERIAQRPAVKKGVGGEYEVKEFASEAGMMRRR